MLIMAGESSWKETHLNKVRKWQESPHTSILTSALILSDDKVDTDEGF